MSMNIEKSRRLATRMPELRKRELNSENDIHGTAELDKMLGIKAERYTEFQRTFITEHAVYSDYIKLFIVNETGQITEDYKYKGGEIVIYLHSFSFPNEEMEFDFFMNIKRTCYDSFYPFKVLSRNGFETIVFEPVTILYGGNGSGKSTALNVIAEKTGIKRDSIYNKSNFYPDYVNMCEMQLKADIPENSRIITSDDVFDYMLNIRNLNEGIDQKREDLFEEYLAEGLPEIVDEVVGVFDSDGEAQQPVGDAGAAPRRRRERARARSGRGG